MAKLKISTELEHYARMLNDLERDATNDIGKAIYDGAKIIADEIKNGIKGIPTIASNARGTPEKPLDGITAIQKAGLIDGFGIAKVKNENGYINVKAGFHGYNKAKSARAIKNNWTTKEQPNAMIARSVESGTSFRRKHPFVAPAIRKAQPAAEKAMAETLDKKIKEKGFE